MLDTRFTWSDGKRAANLLDRILAQGMEACGLSMGEFEVLAALVRGGPPFESRPSELTRSLIITPGAVTARLAALERRGFIARRPDASDGRVQLVALTAKGLHVFEPALEEVVVLCRGVLDALAEEERGWVHRSLAGILATVEGELERPAGSSLN